jgi:hypothetical protein
MSMKKTDLTRMLESKLEGRRKDATLSGRLGPGAGDPGRRERRKLDAAAGLVAFACKLPSDLVQQVRDRAQVEGGDLNAVVAGLLRQAMVQPPN